MDTLDIKGEYVIECYGADGSFKWRQSAKNVVTTVGKSAILDAGLAGSTGYIGLISATSYSAVAAANTMTSHSGWLEAGAANAPTYSGGRIQATWQPASGGAKSIASLAQFTMTSGGALAGAFLVLGSGASNSTDDSGGVLVSAGRFASGTTVVSSGDVIKVNYTMSA